MDGPNPKKLQSSPGNNKTSKKTWNLKKMGNQNSRQIITFGETEPPDLPVIQTSLY